MKPRNPTKKPLLVAALPWLVAALTLIVLAAALGLVSYYLRQQIRLQILNRDGESLHAVATMICAEIAEDTKSPELGEAGQFQALLKASRLKGIIAARLFDSTGQFVASFPINARDGRLPEADAATLRSAQPISHFIEHGDLENVLYRDSKDSPPARFIPLLEANVPLQIRHQAQVQAFAQFIISGESVAAEFARLDRNLLILAIAVGVAGTFLIAMGLRWAFGRLERAHTELAKRSASLTRANQELALSAKSAALGAVSAHLIHGLKNPLFGLQALASENAGRPGNDSAWLAAAETTRRMQEMVNEVVRVLREDQSGTTYEISVEELAVTVCARARPLAAQTGVELKSQVNVVTTVNNHAGNLISLVLVNLTQNAIQASPDGGIVTLSITRENEDVLCRVIDEGRGIPPEAQANLFMPVNSTKPGGTGLGLAISRQLALALNCTLFLENTSESGTIFALRIPAGVCRSAVLDAPSETVPKRL